MTVAMDAFLDAKRAKGRAASTIESAEDRLSMIVGSLMQRPVRALNHRGAELYAAAQIMPNGKPIRIRTRCLSPRTSARSA